MNAALSPRPDTASPSLTPVAEIVVSLGESRIFGGTRDGSRRMTPILGGEMRGLPGAETAGVRDLVATILPGGGDRQLVRDAAGAADGSVGAAGAASTSVEIDAQYDARTASDTLIGIRALGIRRVTPQSAGEPLVYFRVMLRFETSAAELAELQDALYVADGVREASSVRHTVYRVG